ncbi:MAG: glycosyltransferase family 9 protein [Candidatus Sumerlaeota bacterium]|nr:glycosyltransferase family 9 protein [Candidatus Sumerlaeota bacterium]
MALEIPEVKPDCRHYRGYKPCGFRETCDGCPHYSPEGRRILILKLAAAGDVVRTTPLLRPLREREAPCHVTWLTDPFSVDLLRQTSTIDRLLAWSAETCMILEAEAFDLLINFEKEPRALALAKRVPARRKLGFGPAPNGALHVFNRESVYALRLGLSDELKFRVNQKTYPEIVFEMIGLQYKGEEYEIAPSPEARSYAADFARRHGLDGSAPVVGVNTGCGDVFQTKQWTYEGLAGLIRLLRERGDCRVMLLGGPREVELNRRLMAEAGDGVVDSRCDNSIAEFVGLVDLCDVVVAADTMALHIAIGLKKQLVAYFGPTCDQEVGLFGRGEKIVTEFPCSPCYLTTCPKERTCMMALAPETVAEAVGRRLAALRATH